MKRFTSVDKFLEQQTHWRIELQKLRKILLKLPFKETIKWGAPIYTINGKNVVGIGGFKSYVGLWFFNGSFLKDKEHRLTNAQEGKTKGMRQWRFSSMEEMDEQLIIGYLNEAIQNQKEEKIIKVVRNTDSVEIPVAFKKELQKNLKLEEAFEKFSKSKQREFMTHLSEAKREATKQSRL